MLACTANAGVPPAASASVPIRATSIVSTPTPLAVTATPVIGFTPETTQRNAAGVPLPFAPGSVNVVVTYTPVPAGASLIKSGYAMVSLGDNYFYPDEVRITVGSTIEWRYDGGGGETESTHNVVGLDGSFSSGDLFAGTRYASVFEKPGEFAYVCTYHAKQMTGKIIVQ
jgi:plastocyanin